MTRSPQQAMRKKHCRYRTTQPVDAHVPFCLEANFVCGTLTRTHESASKRMKINSCVSIFVLSAFLALPPAAGNAEESPAHKVIQKGKAVVSIEAVDAAIYKDKPQGILDRATGRILIVQKMRRIAAVQTGGGIILDSGGLILTAAHTLKNKKNISVLLFNGTRLPAKVVHEVPEQDLAFLAVTPPFALDTIQFANSDAAPVGMEVYAMGRAQWVKGTLTGGKISAYGIEKISGLPRITSLRINFKAYKGDSGSPILDGHGNLLGMISAGQVAGSATYAIASNMIGTAYRDFRQSV